MNRKKKKKGKKQKKFFSNNTEVYNKRRHCTRCKMNSFVRNESRELDFQPNKTFLPVLRHIRSS